MTKELNKLVELRRSGLNFRDAGYKKLVMNLLHSLPAHEAMSVVFPKLPNFNEMDKYDSLEIFEKSSRWFMQTHGGKIIDRIVGMLSVNPEAKSFLDVGSGTGYLVAIARDLGFEAHGVELSEYLPKIVPSYSDLTIHQEDFFEFDKFGSYDMIYSWNPNPPRMPELAERIMSQAKSGAVIDGLLESALGNPKGAVTKFSKKIWTRVGDLLVKK